MEQPWVTYWAPSESREPPAPATEQQINEAEEQLGVRFPAQLRTMFLEQNGGSLRGQHQESFHDIRRIGGTGLRIEVNDPWWLDQDYWQPDPPLHLLVPMCGDGHNDICLDYRGCGPTGEPEVWMIRQGGPEYMISHSFDEYLAHTVVHTAARIVSESTDVETVADRLAVALDASVNHYSPFSRVNARRGLVVQSRRAHLHMLSVIWRFRSWRSRRLPTGGRANVHKRFRRTSARSDSAFA